MAVGACGGATVCAATHVLLRSARGVFVREAMDDRNAEEGALVPLPAHTQAKPAASAAAAAVKSVMVVFGIIVSPE